MNDRIDLSIINQVNVVSFFLIGYNIRDVELAYTYTQENALTVI